MSRRSVVFPDPLGPSSATNCAAFDGRATRRRPRAWRRTSCARRPRRSRARSSPVRWLARRSGFGYPNSASPYLGSTRLELPLLAGLIRRRWPIPVLAVAGRAWSAASSRWRRRRATTTRSSSTTAARTTATRPVFDDFTKATGIELDAARRHRPGALRAARARGRRHAGRRARHDRPGQPVAGRGRRPARPVDQRRARGQRARGAARPRRRLVGAHHAAARPGRVHRAGRPGRGHQLRGSRRSEVEGPHLPAHVEQRVQPVARGRLDRQAGPRGRPRRCCSRGWTTTPTIYNCDGELLAGMEAGDCDVGLTNHYYLARALDEDADFPVAPAWPDQDGAGAHANVSGVGRREVVRQEGARPRQLIEYLTTPAAQEEIVDGGEFPVNAEVPPEDSAASGQTVKIDPIDVAAGRAADPGRHRADARPRVGADAASPPSRRPGRPGGRSPRSSSRSCSIAAAARAPGQLHRRERRLRPDLAHAAPRRAAQQRLLALGVGVGTLALGGGLALLVSFYDFPGRRVLDWALVLPLAVPGYVLVFVVLGQFGMRQPVPVEPLRRGPAASRGSARRSARS